MVNNGLINYKEHLIMNKTVTIIICVLVLVATPTYGRKGAEYIRWSHGDFEIPVEIKDANSVSKLQHFLYGKNEFKRMAAVRRLGEIEGSRAVGLLREVSANEPPIRGVLDRSPLVRLEVVRTLGRIGGEEAKTVLLEMLEEFWHAGPQVSDTGKQYWYYDVDFANLVPASLEQLYAWSNDKKVYDAAMTIASSEDIKKYGSRISQALWKVYLKGEIAQKRLSEKESVIHLLRFYEDVKKYGVASGSLEESKMKAVSDVLLDSNDVVLTGLAKEFENTHKEAVSRNDPNAGDILHDMRYIENILKAKKAKTENPKAEK
jgi:hypothetical protein